MGRISASNNWNGISNWLSWRLHTDGKLTGGQMPNVNAYIKQYLEAHGVPIPMVKTRKRKSWYMNDLKAAALVSSNFCRFTNWVLRENIVLVQ